MRGKLALLAFLVLIKLLKPNCEFYRKTTLLSLRGILKTSFSKVFRF